jgi:cysteine-rich repeat protein
VDAAQETHLWYSAFVEKDTNMMAATDRSFRWDASAGFVGGKLFVDSATSGNSCDNQLASGANFTMLADTTCTSKNLAQLEMFDFVSATSQLMDLAEWPAMRAYLDPLDASDPYVYQAAPPPGTVCGDGHLWGAEECDEGGWNTALCNSDCTTPACGDAQVNPAFGEECDPASASALCSACTFTSAFFTECGNGSLSPDSVEACDDNNNNSGDGCSATCQTEFCGNYRVDSGNTPCSGDVNCLGIGPEVCDLGPGVCIVEECDDGPAGSLFCTPTCTVAPRPGETREVEHVFHDNGTLTSQADCVRYFPGSTYDAGLNGCRTYVLIGAYETIGDKDANLQPVGNENGLCESGETCTVLEHVGASQPPMSTGSYIFNGDFITGVMLQ